MNRFACTIWRCQPTSPCWVWELSSGSHEQKRIISAFWNIEIVTYVMIWQTTECWAMYSMKQTLDCFVLFPHSRIHPNWPASDHVTTNTKIQQWCFLVGCHCEWMQSIYPPTFNVSVRKGAQPSTPWALRSAASWHQLPPTHALLRCICFLIQMPIAYWTHPPLHPPGTFHIRLWGERNLPKVHRKSRSCLERHFWVCSWQGRDAAMVICLYSERLVSCDKQGPWFMKVGLYMPPPPCHHLTIAPLVLCMLYFIAYWKPWCCASTHK